MHQTIEVDSQVFAALQERAEPLVDTPNSVLRRLLGLGDDSTDGVQVAGVTVDRAKKPLTTSRAKNKRKPTKALPARTRAPAGSLLPEAEYEIPMLEALVDLGGSAPSRDVVGLVGKKLGGRLTELDRSALASGGVRWENRLQFVRLRLINQGLMVKKTGRGIWAISEAGQDKLTTKADQ